jgi:NDP-sugar pyrophosphorylase family protein
VKAFLLAAGRGERFRPVTERIPKALLPFLNVALARAHLSRLASQGVREAGLNLHHLGDKIQRDLRDRAVDLPKLEFFQEDPILGTAGALKNAAAWLGPEDFLVVNCDAAIEFDLTRLWQTHAASGRGATLLTVENRAPERYTPLQAEGDIITAFGGESSRPLLYTGVCVLSPRLLPGVPEGEASLVGDVWVPMLARGEKIGYVLHDGPFADLGRPGDFLRASLEALSRGGPFPAGAGVFEPESRVLSQVAISHFAARSSVLGLAAIGSGTQIIESAVFSGAEIGPGGSLERCLVAGGRVTAGAHHTDSLLWPGPDGVSRPLQLEPLEPPESGAQGFHAASPRR